MASRREDGRNDSGEGFIGAGWTLWSWCSRNELDKVLGRDSADLVATLGLKQTFAHNYAKPAEAAVREFVTNFPAGLDIEVATFRGKDIRLDNEVIRQCFFLPCRSAKPTLPCEWSRQTASRLLEDDPRRPSCKRLVRSCRNWKSPIEAVNMLLLGKPRPGQAHDNLLFYFHAYLEGGVDEHCRPDWAELVATELKREIWYLRLHLARNYTGQPETGPFETERYAVHCGTAVMRLLMFHGFSEEELNGAQTITRPTGKRSTRTPNPRPSPSSDKDRQPQKRLRWAEDSGSEPHRRRSSERSQGGPEQDGPFWPFPNQNRIGSGHHSSDGWMRIESSHYHKLQAENLQLANKVKELMHSRADVEYDLWRLRCGVDIGSMPRYDEQPLGGGDAHLGAFENTRNEPCHPEQAPSGDANLKEDRSPQSSQIREAAHSNLLVSRPVKGGHFRWTGERPAFAPDTMLQR